MHTISTLDNCGVRDLPRHLDPNGSLTVVENTPACPFGIKRVFYLYDVPADSERGGHSHHKAQELIVAVSGSFDVTLHDGRNKHLYHLDRPYRALYITAGVWRTLENFSAGAVCLVLTSEKFDENDYVRDFDRFLSLTAHKAYDKIKYPFLDLKRVNAPYIDRLKEAAARVIDSGRYIGGDEVEALEHDLRHLTGATFAIGVSNGLDALRLIFRAYKEIGMLSDGDEVIVPANTYIASVLAVTDNGLTPVFVDPDPATYNLDTAKLEQALTPRTRAVLTVHLYGRACWNRALADLSRHHGLLVVEDNAQAIGARTNCPGIYGSKVTGTLGHAAAFSFYPTKNIGAVGDAGAVTTYDKHLADTIRALRNYGSDTRYHNIYAGLNCRLDPLQAAFLRVKLSDLDRVNAHRRELASIYNRLITNPKVKLPKYSTLAVWHQYVVRVADRDAFRAYMQSMGVGTDVLYPVPPHRQPCYSRFAHLSLPVAEALAREVVSLPLNEAISPDDARKIAEIVNKF